MIFGDFSGFLSSEGAKSDSEGSWELKSIKKTFVFHFVFNCFSWFSGCSRGHNVIWIWMNLDGSGLAGAGSPKLTLQET